MSLVNVESDETDMVHTTETLLQRPQPVTVPVSAIVDRAYEAIGERLRARARELRGGA